MGRKPFFPILASLSVQAPTSSCSMWDRRKPWLVYEGCCPCQQSRPCFHRCQWGGRALYPSCQCLQGNAAQAVFFSSSTSIKHLHFLDRVMDEFLQAGFHKPCFFPWPHVEVTDLMGPLYHRGQSEPQPLFCSMLMDTSDPWIVD